MIYWDQIYYCFLAAVSNSADSSSHKDTISLFSCRYHFLYFSELNGRLTQIWNYTHLLFSTFCPSWKEYKVTDRKTVFLYWRLLTDFDCIYLRILPHIQCKSKNHIKTAFCSIFFSIIETIPSFHTCVIYWITKMYQQIKNEIENKNSSWRINGNNIKIIFQCRSLCDHSYNTTFIEYNVKLNNFILLYTWCFIINWIWYWENHFCVMTYLSLLKLIRDILEDI